MIAADIAGLSLPMVALCVVLALIGSTIQGTLGFGLGMLTSPIFAMIDPSFVPAALMVAVLPLTVGVAARDRAHIDSTGFKWALLGRFPGVFIGSGRPAGHEPRHLGLCRVISRSVRRTRVDDHCTTRTGDPDQLVDAHRSRIREWFHGHRHRNRWSAHRPRVQQWRTCHRTSDDLGLFHHRCCHQRRRARAVRSRRTSRTRSDSCHSSRRVRRTRRVVAHRASASRQVMRPLILTLCAFSGSLLLLRTAL